MKFFTKVLKNKLFYLVLLLGVFVIPIFKFNLQAQEEDYVEVDSTLEFNVIDFTTNELDVDPATVYNFFRNGFLFNDDVTFLLNDVEYNVTSYTVNHLKEFTMEFNVGGETYKITSTPTTLNIYSYIEVDGDDVENLEGMRFVWNSSRLYSTDNISFSDIVFTSNYDVYNKLYLGKTSQPRFVARYYSESDVYVTVTTDGYIEPEYRIIDFISDNLEDNSGLINILKSRGTFYDITKGFDDGDNVKITLRNLIPQSYFEFIDEAQYEAKYNDGYNQAREDYGYYDEEADKWVKVDERKQVFYDEGYQDGVSDIHDYYNDNGLFIPKLTPKGHLVIDFDLRYGEPYFYLQDFYHVDDVYFGYQHNRWLEKAFDWAYDNETDFLAINDLFVIKYQSDEILYKYWFYKYDTDSIYCYNDNGTLLKIVERTDFDYYAYELEDLTQAEQARIDNAYNKGMRDYGYYDSESEEYLTATEYGEIQYNLGVQRTKDRAYLDGFTVGIWDSHRYGYDWVRATYYELIAERPILYNVSDITSFAFGEGHDEGFNEARRQYGLYFDGRLWLTADDAYDLGYDEGRDVGYGRGYDDGLDDGYDDGYRVGLETTSEVMYDEIYNKGYKDGQKTGMNNKFYTGLEKWIVPAIIVVLFFGLLMLFPKNKED